ncbi:hypothetical protein ACFO3O_14385 [Dokdonia ponticola]|uniref:Uncharacterized protein n=1 Tax=Dokdonia ponticola TaxID=2041041 RepID=A0ABV9I0U3_9FLAO
MDFDIILKELKEEISDLAKEKFEQHSTAIIEDAEAYLAHSKEKLKKWGQLFKQGQIDKEELVWLLKSQKELFLLKSLQTIGVSSIKAGHFKNKILNTILSKITTTVL